MPLLLTVLIASGYGGESGNDNNAGRQTEGISSETSRKHLETLATAPLFGFGVKLGQRPDARATDGAFRVLMQSPNALERFAELFERENSYAKLYALCALRRLDPKVFDRLAGRLDKNQPVRRRDGCCLDETTTGAILTEIRNGRYDYLFEAVSETGAKKEGEDAEHENRKKAADEATAKERSRERAKLLGEKAPLFGLELRYHGAEDKPYYRLSLLGTAHKFDSEPGGFDSSVSLDERLARKLIDHLSSEGFLAKAMNIAYKKIKYPDGPAYTVTVTGAEEVLYEDLGWGLPMLERLDAMAKVLEGDAAKAMGTLIGRLEGQRKEWEKEEAEKKANLRKLWNDCDLAVTGTIAAVQDATERDGPIFYDVEVDRILTGDTPEKKIIRCGKSAWTGVPRYEKGERVLLFLKKSAMGRPWDLMNSPGVTLNPAVEAVMESVKPDN